MMFSKLFDDTNLTNQSVDAFIEMIVIPVSLHTSYS
jgi:hypothetical protein